MSYGPVLLPNRIAATGKSLISSVSKPHINPRCDAAMTCNDVRFVVYALADFAARTAWTTSPKMFDLQFPQVFPCATNLLDDNHGYMVRREPLTIVSFPMWVFLKPYSQLSSSLFCRCSSHMVWGFSVRCTVWPAIFGFLRFCWSACHPWLLR